MGQLINILVGLSTTLIGYIIGRLWQGIVIWLPYRRARIFWGPALAGQLQVVVSRFQSTAFVEPTGLVGGGDALALRELSSYFARVGLKQFDVVYVDEADLDRKNNLILLGGPDTNEVTKDALELINPRVRIVDPGPGCPVEIHDLAPICSTDNIDTNERSSEKKYRPEPEVDYGIIIRARNPFNPGKTLIIFAGAYGFGTWGGVSLALDDSFLQSCAQLELHNRHRASLMSMLNRLKRFLGAPAADLKCSQFECILSVSVFDQRPHAPEIIAFRPLP